MRRMRAFLKRHKFREYAIQLLIVVLGVFIGIQASNWNQQRATDKAAADFTDRLVADLRAEMRAYELYVDYNQDVLANAYQAVGALEGRADLSDEALLVAAYRATQYIQAPSRRATYDELISTGNIGLIRDQLLRETALTIYNRSAVSDLVNEGKGSLYRQAFRMSVMNDMQRTLGLKCGDRTVKTDGNKVVNVFLEDDCATGLSKETIAQAAEALRSNPELKPLLRMRISDLETRLTDLATNRLEILGGLPASKQR